MKIRNNQTRKEYEMPRGKWDSLSEKAKKIFTVIDHSDSKTDQEIKAEKFERPDSGDGKRKRNKQK